MMSLGVTKGGPIPPTDEDRRRIIRQMKVRTTLRGDKSWIQHHNSDSDEEKGSPRSSAPKPQSGYLIRGVFTRTIDKSSSTPDPSAASPAQKSTALKGQSRSPSGYRMTTEDYKKLAPYNVRQKSVDGEEEDVPFSPDEHKKRTEAANSVLRRSAGRERAYVLSAAKKSNGSPTQEFPPLFAKRIEIEEEEGQQRRSPTVPGSSRVAPESSSANGLRKTSPGSSWDEPKAAAASVPKPGSRSQTSPSLSDTLGTISTSAEIRNGEDRQALSGKFSLETVSQAGDGDKALKEKPERFPWDEGAPKATRAATNGSFAEHTEAKNGLYPPESALQPDVPFHPTERTPVHIENTEYSFKSSVLGYEERSSSTNPEGPSHHQPYWDETRFLDSVSLTERGQGAPGHESPPEPPRLKDATEPSRAGRSEFSSQEGVGSAHEPQPPVPLFQERQSFGGSVPSHRIPGYVDSQAFSTRRPSPDPKGNVYGSSSPRSSWYDSARGLGDFSPPAGRHDSFPRDPTMSMPQRSHRVPFYMDSLNSNSSRLLSSSSERLCSSHHSSGYQPDSSSAGSSEPLCSYCSREIRDCPKIIIEHLNIHCHEYCFRCGICHKAMGDLLDKIFIHRDIVHCDKCYEKLF
nr:zinc finger protein 185 [Zonotrichia albicollis]